MTAIANHPHRVSSAIAEARASISSVAEVPVWSLDPVETAAALQDLKALAAQVAELQTRVLAHADRSEVASHGAASSTANWHAVTTATTRQQAHRLMRIAHGLDTHEAARTALAAGRIHLEQAEVILRALGDLPDDLDPELVARAEAHLLELAGDHDARSLKLLGMRLLEVVSPRDRRRPRGQAVGAGGATRGRGDPADHVGRRPRPGPRPVHPRPAHRRDAQEGPVRTRLTQAPGQPRPARWAAPHPGAARQAFTEYVQRYPAQRLPQAGGLNATVLVLLDYDSLLGGLKAARLNTGQQISASLARRLVCEAGIIPAVLGGQSQVLDLGRKKRFHTEAQRIVKTVEAGGCEVEGCDCPPGMTHIHHPVR